MSTKYTPADVYLSALCLWREARSEKVQGMTCVMAVIINRMKYRGQTASQVVMAPWQFSSMTAENDPQLDSYPMAQDPIWAIAQNLALTFLRGLAQDPTGGADMYYAESLSIAPPSVPKGWGDPNAYQFLCKIGRHFFFREHR